jgi:hypothetical protein
MDNHIETEQLDEKKVEEEPLVLGPLAVQGAANQIISFLRGMQYSQNQFNTIQHYSTPIQPKQLTKVKIAIELHLWLDDPSSPPLIC